MSKPARVLTSDRFLKRAAGLVGLVVKPATHNLRRGAAADLSAITNATSTAGAARGLGHSRHSTALGITDAYMGHSTHDTWAPRLQQLDSTSSSATQSRFGLQTAPTPYKQVRASPRDIVAWCKTNQLDDKVPKFRDRALRALYKEQFAQWQDRQNSILAGELPMPPTPSPHPSRAPLKDVTNVSQSTPSSAAQTRKPMKQSEQRAASKSTVGNDHDTHDDDDDVLHDDDHHTSLVPEENIDPVLRVFAGHLSGRSSAPVTMGSQQAAASEVELMAEECVSVLATADSQLQDGDGLAVLVAPQTQFITYLSTINVFVLAGHRSLDTRAAGNSRDAPSRFLFHCRTQDCPKSFTAESQLRTHARNCRPPLQSAYKRSASLMADDDNDQDQIVIPAPAAKKISKIAREWVPKPCPDSATCGVTRNLSTYAAFKGHRRACHDTTWPADMTCNLPGCRLPEDRTFRSRQDYRNHLAQGHHLNNEEIGKVLAKIPKLPGTAPQTAQ
jgi:hypothetical protein